MSRLLPSVLVLFLSQDVFALSISFDFANAVRSSAVVAWVEIERGETIAAPAGQSCGARYFARIVNSIKGASVGQRIEFGHYFGRAIGNQYVVFLNETAEVVRHTAGVAPPPMLSPVPYISVCAKQLPRYIESAEGVGTIPIELGEYVSYRPAVSLKGPPYVIPMSLVGSNHRTGTVVEDRLFGAVQVEASSFLEYLRSLAGAP